MKTRKRTIVTPRRATPPKPEIFVRIAGSRWGGYARASIRVKAGQYNYLVWRDGDRIRNFYLGKKRKS